MEQTFDVEVRHVEQAQIWTNRSVPGRKTVCADIPRHGFYSCPATTYARMIRRSRQELLDRIADVNCDSDAPPLGQYTDWPKPLLAVMCGEWEGD